MHLLLLLLLLHHLFQFFLLLTTCCRVNFKAFLVYSLANVVVYAVPAAWVWGELGFLRQLGAIDNAGWVQGDQTTTYIG